MSIIVSAPGKLLLLGEHAVVYNRPCLVTSVSSRLRVKAERLSLSEFRLEAENVGISDYHKPIGMVGKGNIPKGARFVEMAVGNFMRNYKVSGGVKIDTSSGPLFNYGFGSSSASVAATIKALAELFGIELSSKELFDLSLKSILAVQGAGSGVDVAAAIYGGVVYFVKGGKVIEPLNIESLPLVVGYSGVKADTVSLIKKVAERREKYRELIENVFDQIGIIVEEAKEAVINRDWGKLGELMDINQGFLESLGVVNRKLSNMIYAARDAGAFGAKISGAGGGDCMIALVSHQKKDYVSKAIEKAGGENISIRIDVEGIKYES